MSFRKKIDMILEAKRLDRLSINKIERLLGVDGTIYKAHKAGEYPKDPNLISELIQKLNIRQAWWDKDWESGNMDVFNENGTQVHNKPMITAKDQAWNLLEQALARLEKNYNTQTEILNGVRADLQVARSERDIAQKERDELKKELEQLRERTASPDNVK